eukprot:CAMPEP_0119302764 /NCGR_PEP_ID=MMETSP1333-20130426/4309_1 /TAXON_ID=418940 /ORGANISM="Scyphosphaera apsteinii, Strain RCC1455" /LENGTH=51 /DNA_ID=CAMNT_0007305223 /DNA_START=232 /DNA_END=387 /DNA_ORIENTATION=+
MSASCAASANAVAIADASFAASNIDSRAACASTSMTALSVSAVRTCNAETL